MATVYVVGCFIVFTVNWPTEQLFPHRKLQLVRIQYRGVVGFLVFHAPPTPRARPSPCPLPCVGCVHHTLSATRPGEALTGNNFRGRRVGGCRATYWNFRFDRSILWTPKRLFLFSYFFRQKKARPPLFIELFCPGKKLKRLPFVWHAYTHTHTYTTHWQTHMHPRIIINTHANGATHEYRVTHFNIQPNRPVFGRKMLEFGFNLCLLMVVVLPEILFLLTFFHAAFKTYCDDPIFIF